MELRAIFTVTLPSTEADAATTAIETASVAETNAAISDAVATAGYGGTVEAGKLKVTGGKDVCFMVIDG